VVAGEGFGEGRGVIAKFLFAEKIWTYGQHVRNYEQIWERYLKFFPDKTYAIMVSSGSTANELIAMRRKWELQRVDEWPRRNKVIFPVNTWISSVSPWINLGFEPVFVDVEKHNLNVLSDALAKAFSGSELGSIGTVFYTALLGFFGDLEKCKKVTEDNGARFLMDNCEASFSEVGETDGWNKWAKPICAFATCSTSIYVSHFTTSSTEGGLIFTQNEEEAEWFRMARNHGMTRGMPDQYKNPKVNPDFDFYLMGSNYRSSNLAAYMASLDFERGSALSTHRRTIWETFSSELLRADTKKEFWFLRQPPGEDIVVPLAIPIVTKTPEKKARIEGYLKAKGVMTRPIIGGCLLHHTAFQGYGNPEDYPVANHAHHCGLYIGLHKDVTVDMARKLAREIASL
jgi:CDP-6-deoxy-D-xylo-4-hexulose-3-dehydrase